jgi:hypothetical protein
MKDEPNGKIRNDGPIYNVVSVMTTNDKTSRCVGLTLYTAPTE